MQCEVSWLKTCRLVWINGCWHGNHTNYKYQLTQLTNIVLGIPHYLLIYLRSSAALLERLTVFWIYGCQPTNTLSNFILSFRSKSENRCDNWIDNNFITWYINVEIFRRKMWQRKRGREVHEKWSDCLFVCGKCHTASRRHKNTINTR